MDFQLCRVSSLAIDLNHVLFTSLETSLLKFGFDHLLKNYYDTYSNIITKSGLEVPFSYDELENEFLSKNPYGFIMGTVMLSFIFLDDDNLIDFTAIGNSEEAQKETKIQYEKLINIVKSGGMFKERLFAFLESMILHKNKWKIDYLRM